LYTIGSVSFEERRWLRERPKIVVVSSLAKTPKFAQKFQSEVMDEAVFGEEPVRPVNLLEKSILKISRRKRSMSVDDAESMIQKRVTFISPQVMEIGTIDEQMMASFMKEREMSLMKQAAPGSARLKRSLSTGKPLKTTQEEVLSLAKESLTEAR
jgi:hypothetical protein